jgi:hypothetical protein
LEVTQLAKDDGPTKRHVRHGWVDAELHAQGDAGPGALVELCAEVLGLIISAHPRESARTCSFVVIRR